LDFGSTRAWLPIGARFGGRPGRASESWRAGADPPLGGKRPSSQAFLSAVGEMPSVVLQNLPMASCVILTGVLPLLIFPSTRRGMTVGQRSAFGGRKACPVAKERPVAEVAYATGCTACRIRHWRASPQLRGDLLRDAPLPLLNQSFSPLTPTPPCVPRPETDAVSCACAGLAGRGCVQSGSMEHMY
jgi:hypothetical protein